jgi:hypothetical protein
MQMSCGYGVFASVINAQWPRNDWEIVESSDELDDVANRLKT